jgi:serine protease Do
MGLGSQQPLAGAVVANLSPAVADELGVGFAARAVIVVRTLPNSPAGQPGDIVLFVNDKRIALVDDLVDAVCLPRDSWRLSILRGARTLKVAIGG